MLTRGYQIGKIVDDVAALKVQLETRNGLGLLDLTKFTEDFFRDILNIIYGYDLYNLNINRSNYPGLDLGDTNGEAGYQITSTKTSQKISDTLNVITDAQLKSYKKIKVFIIGNKQSSYSIEPSLLKRTKFSVEEDIVDLDDLLKEIMVLSVGKLEAVFNLFKMEFRALKIEFEIVDSDGHFDSSLYNQLQKVPDQPPANARKLKKYFDEEVSLKSIVEVYHKLANLPRNSRELLAIIAERGDKRNFNHSRKEWGILPGKLSGLLNMSYNELEDELLMLFDCKLIYLGEDDINDQTHNFVALYYETINIIVDWAVENKLSIRKLFNTMNFSVMDK